MCKVENIFYLAFPAFWRLLLFVFRYAKESDMWFLQSSAKSDLSNIMNITQEEIFKEKYLFSFSTLNNV